MISYLRIHLLNIVSHFIYFDSMALSENQQRPVRNDSFLAKLLQVPRADYLKRFSVQWSSVVDHSTVRYLQDKQLHWPSVRL